MAEVSDRFDNTNTFKPSFWASPKYQRWCNFTWKWICYTPCFRRNRKYLCTRVCVYTHEQHLDHTCAGGVFFFLNKCNLNKAPRPDLLFCVRTDMRDKEMPEGVKEWNNSKARHCFLRVWAVICTLPSQFCAQVPPWHCLHNQYVSCSVLTCLFWATLIREVHTFYNAPPSSFWACAMNNFWRCHFKQLKRIYVAQ